VAQEGGSGIYRDVAQNWPRLLCRNFEARTKNGMKIVRYAIMRESIESILGGKIKETLKGSLNKD